jgi:hypothetical protein
MRTPLANPATATRMATAVAVLEGGVPPPAAMKATAWANSSWPFKPADVTPLEWWRTLPADHFGDAQQLVMRGINNKICTMRGQEWLAALRGDAAACVAVAFAALPITEISLEIDLAMSALTVVALDGNAAAAVLLSHILQQTPLDHPFARELSVSWLAFNLQRALEKSRGTAVDAEPGSRRGRTGQSAAIDRGGSI